MHNPTIQLETERLLLRQWKIEDVDPYAAICADPRVMKQKGMEPWDRQQAWRHMATMIGHWAIRGYGHWAIEEKATGNMIGRAGFLNPDGYPGFEIGWTLANHTWGKGYATEAAKCALHYAFNELGQEQVISLILPTNLPSIRVAEKIGETYLRNERVNGFDLLVYGIGKAAYLEHKLHNS